jgi:glutamate 5-kinase
LKLEGDRRELLQNCKRIVVKIGSGVLTSHSFNGLDIEYIESLVDCLSLIVLRGYELVIVTSGAIIAGVKKLGLKGRPRSIPEKQAAAAVGQAMLMWVYERSFAKNGLQVAQILLTREDLSDRRRFLNARSTLLTLLNMGVVPIINENDSVVIDEIKFGDNDNLSALTTNLIQADLLIILTDLDGLYDADPKRDPNAKLIPVVREINDKIESYAGLHPSSTGTGGMISKLQAAKMASAFGVPTVIANGRIATTVSEIIEGRDIGTLILPKENRVSSWKYWIAYTLLPSGLLIVDDGAREVIMKEGKSLLPSGISDVEGEFDRGESVGCAGPDRKEFARGLVNYSSSEIRKIKGLKTSQIESILGYKYYDEVIHRDDLVLL